MNAHASRKYVGLIRLFLQDHAARVDRTQSQVVRPHWRGPVDAMLDMRLSIIMGYQVGLDRISVTIRITLYHHNSKDAHGDVITHQPNTDCDIIILYVTSLRTHPHSGLQIRSLPLPA